ncbi:dihydroxyacetone kinase subunit DhaL [Herbaspirillum robiniae]|uniref:Dihydroxyacetone kinase subunit DhaK n=1 Tax=Herbaspirillum robiniae TaxID=2014887 RepID=A0ABX2LY25_9BURK|nr:dihydroxyacetone kinase subunit DhaL [Herbaspirillum robiniae]NUU01858.1 dihydroxyacetone kinase subunit DhaK [Herbaspirillum robiniae]
MKKLINEVAHVVPDMLAGLAALHPQLALLQGQNIVLRADAREAASRGEVALISGGGAGHEPAHGGYVGAGMLSAAVAGEVFTSPSTDAVLEAIRAVAGRAGVLLIVKNYTGDRLNFGLAAEIARAEGIAVEMVVVADDVALSANGDHAGRRGLAGTVLVHKIAGAAASGGAPLAEVAQAARDAAAALGTMGVALTPCTVPAAGKPGFTLGEAEIEWGLGIHGEAGVERGTLVPAADVAARLLKQIAGDLALQAGERVALLVNNLGGTPASELDIVAGSALAQLAQQNIKVERAWAGTFLSALEMAGISLTLLRVDERRLALLDAATQAPAWPAGDGRIAAGTQSVHAAAAAPVTPTPQDGARMSADAPLRRVIEAVCARLQQAEALLTDMDQKVGDGDLGISMARAAQGIREDMAGWPSEQQPAAVLRAMSATVRRVVGGTSGPLYAILLMRAAASLEEQRRANAPAWAAAFSEAVKGVMELGGAKTGDRTMVDALLPAAQALQASLDAGETAAVALDAAVSAAEQGAAATAAMTPRRGRSSYIGQRALGHPDPGAHAVGLWLASVCDALKA